MADTSVGRLVKESMIGELSKQLEQAPNFFVASITRLPASEADVFRRKLSTSQASMLMIKRRLGLRTLADLKISGFEKLLSGSVGFIIPTSEDVLPIAKTLVDFVKSHEEQISVQGAMIDGQLLDKKNVEHLASLPGKPALLAQVVFTLEAPISDLIFTVEQLIGDIAWLAEQAAEKKPQAEAAAEKPQAPAEPVPDAENKGQVEPPAAPSA